MQIVQRAQIRMLGRDMVLEKGYEIVFGTYRLLSVQDTFR